MKELIGSVCTKQHFSCKRYTGWSAKIMLCKTGSVLWEQNKTQKLYWASSCKLIEAVGYLTIIGSDNGLSPDRRQVIICTNAGILLIGPLETNVSKILSEIHTFSVKKIHLKSSSGQWPFCLSLIVLMFAFMWGMFTHGLREISVLGPYVHDTSGMTNRVYTNCHVIWVRCVSQLECLKNIWSPLSSMQTVLWYGLFVNTFCCLIWIYWYFLDIYHYAINFQWLRL